jgi:hypothetical protein
MSFFEKEIDPVTGLITEYGSEDGKFLVRYTQDTEPLHRQNQSMRDDKHFTKAGIKADLVRVVSLSDSDCMKLIVEDGIDPYKCSATELKNHLYRHKDKWGHLFTTRGRF